MCLVKKSKIPRITLKNIIVYKVLRAFELDNKKYYETFFRNFQVSLNCTYTGKFNRYDSFYESFKSPWINSGYIHSFNSLDRAKEISSNPDICIVKCIIPIGTLYWIGDDCDIASRKLKYKEVIVKEKYARIYYKMEP